MKNKKGIIIGGLSISGVALGFTAAYSIVMGAAFWHVPAWEKAKASGPDAEKAYQAQKMWPQQLFAKLPGGDNYKK